MGSHFYIILRGIVAVKVKNPNIENWAQKRKRLKELIDWKRREIDKRIDEAIINRFQYNSMTHVDIENCKVHRKKFRMQMRFKQGFSKNGEKFSFDVMRDCCWSATEL